MNINYDLLKKVCLSPIESFTSLGDVYDTHDGIYIYKKNPKAKILAVAHLDSVLDTDHFHLVKDKKDTIVINAQLDDRLGVYTMLDILPRLGIEFDLLLTEGEEQGRSTAAYFETDKQYNWMFSFDRRLNDVVMYQYDNPAIRADLQKAGFKIGNGSFSDISFMDHLGIRGFNVGTGYDEEHSPLCHAYMGMLLSQVNKFAAFYRTNQDIHYPYEKSVKAYKLSFAKWDDLQDTCYICEQIKPNGEEYGDVYICDDCISHVMECVDCGDMVVDTDLTDGLCKYCRMDN